MTYLLSLDSLALDTAVSVVTKKRMISRNPHINHAELRRVLLLLENVMGIISHKVLFFSLCRYCKSNRLQFGGKQVGKGKIEGCIPNGTIK